MEERQKEAREGDKSMIPPEKRRLTLFEEDEEKRSLRFIEMLDFSSPSSSSIFDDFLHNISAIPPVPEYSPNSSSLSSSSTDHHHKPTDQNDHGHEDEQKSTKNQLQ